jgi:hypothetical protein
MHISFPFHSSLIVTVNKGGIIILTFHVNMNELGGELAKPAGFDIGRLSVLYTLMMCIWKGDTQFAVA